MTLAGGDAPLPAALRDAFLSRARTLQVRKGQIIISEGAATSEVYLVLSGEVQFSLISAAGREVILRSLGSHCLFGENAAIDGLPRSVQAVALGDCQLAQMPGDAFVELLGEVPQFGLWLIRQLSARIRDLTGKSFELAAFPVATRLQGELLCLAAAAPPLADGVDRAIIRPVPTHADLAARIGSHREAVSRELSQLAQEGLVRQSGRTLEIVSLSRLRSLSDRMRR